MDENEEKEYNDIESLAAYLHSGKMQAAAAGKDPQKNPDTDSEVYSGSEDRELENVLYTNESRRKKKSRRSSQFRTHEDTVSQAPEANVGSLEEILTFGETVVEPKETYNEQPDDNSGIPTAPVTAEPVHQEEIPVYDEPEYDEQISQPSHSTKKRRTSRNGSLRRKSVGADASAGITSLAESLSESLEEKAAELAEQQKDALPPEDTPEVFDIPEGSEQEEEFDKTATRLMNAVNDPQSRNAPMREEMEAEREEIHEEKVAAARLRRGYERQKQSTRTLAYILIALVLCAGILGAAAFASSYAVRWALDFTGVGSTEFQIDVEIPDDADIETVAAILAENNIIQDAKFFKFFAGIYDKIKSDTNNTDFIGGKYSLSSTMSYSTLLKMLRTESTVKKTVDVRITEGMTAREIGVLLEEYNVCFAEDFEKYYKNIQNVYDFERRIKESPDKLYQLEGYLFPDTYQFYVVNQMENGGKAGRNETDEEAYEKMRKASEENAKAAAKKMYSNFNEKITKRMYKKMGEMNMTLDEVITLASMVQKEAAYVEDMQYVASVFLNRIRNSASYPFLQSDVTVLYAENEIKPYFSGSEAEKTRLCNAYNTYVCEGIPAGPVCNPGVDAINAVLFNIDTPYFYFCANEETGEIFYAQTQEEHEQNLILAGLRGGESTVNEGGESGTFE